MTFYLEQWMGADVAAIVFVTIWLLTEHDYQLYNKSLKSIETRSHSSTTYIKKIYSNNIHLSFLFTLVKILEYWSG